MASLRWRGCSSDSDNELHEAEAKPVASTTLLASRPKARASQPGGKAGSKGGSEEKAVADTPLKKHRVKMQWAARALERR